MTIIDRLNIIERIDQLIRQKRTGTTVELARKICLSERQTRRYIEEMRDMGAEIEFCKSQSTFKYTKPLRFNYGFQEIELNKIKGGFFRNWSKNGRQLSYIETLIY